MTIKIALGNNRFALLSEEDKDLASLSWYAHKGTGDYYYAAHRYGVGNNLYEREWMHRLVLERMLNRHLKPRVEVPDHINGNKLDNRRENLRLANKSQNEANKRSFRGMSKFKGVSWVSSRRKWRATISKEGKYYSLGSFPGTREGELEAAKAYNGAAAELFGEFAQLNDVS